MNGCTSPHPLFPQVRDGARVSQDQLNYWDRVWTHSMSIDIRNVNYSDEGYYTLKDRQSRVVSVTRMDLTGWSRSRQIMTATQHDTDKRNRNPNTDSRTNSTDAVLL